MGRDHWGSRTTFLLAAIGSAVGLGNVWRFPYLTYKFGGGAFLIPYLIALFAIGVPMLVMEFAIGQKMQAGAVKSFRKLHKRWGGLGVFALTSSFILVCYYAVIMAWSLLYFFGSFGVKWAGQSEDYFFNQILQLSPDVGTLGGINIPILMALAAVWIMVYFCIWKGVKSVGAIVWLTVPLPLLLLGMLLIRGVMLPGFLEGWLFYLQPDWAALTDPDVWIAAISQIFFTIGLAFGIMIAYASYNDKKEKVVADSYITAITNSCISLFAGFVVFAVLGYMATQTGVSVADVAVSGPGLAFVVFPEALSLMPFASLFAAAFFLMLLSLGIDSAFSLVEAINASLADTKFFSKWQPQHMSLVVCGALFLGGAIFTTRAGLYLLDIVDHFISNYNAVLVGLLECILVGWIYGAKKLRTWVNKTSHTHLHGWWDICIKYLIPVALVALLVTQFMKEISAPYEGYPVWALSIGWITFLIPLGVFVFSLLRTPSRS